MKLIIIFGIVFLLNLAIVSAQLLSGESGSAFVGFGILAVIVFFIGSRVFAQFGKGK